MNPMYGGKGGGPPQMSPPQMSPPQMSPPQMSPPQMQMPNGMNGFAGGKGGTPLPGMQNGGTPLPGMMNGMSNGAPKPAQDTWDSGWSHGDEGPAMHGGSDA